MSEGKKGKFLVVEGRTGCGKTTNIRLIKELMPDWILLREPGGTQFGEEIRNAVQSIRQDVPIDRYASLFAYMSARANLVRTVLIPGILSGKNFILDRYWFSTFAYQGSEGISRMFITLCSMWATSGLMPDLVLEYTLSGETLKKRLVYKDDLDRFDVKGMEYLDEVEKQYRLMSLLFWSRWIRVSSEPDVVTVHHNTLKVLNNRLGLNLKPKL